MLQQPPKEESMQSESFIFSTMQHERPLKMTHLITKFNLYKITTKTFQTSKVFARFSSNIIKLWNQHLEFRPINIFQEDAKTKHKLIIIFFFLCVQNPDQFFSTFYKTPDEKQRLFFPTKWVSFFFLFFFLTTKKRVPKMLIQHRPTNFLCRNSQTGSH